LADYSRLEEFVYNKFLEYAAGPEQPTSRCRKLKKRGSRVFKRLLKDQLLSESHWSPKVLLVGQVSLRGRIGELMGRGKQYSMHSRGAAWLPVLDRHIEKFV
jgi:hypothetical protein